MGDQLKHHLQMLRGSVLQCVNREAPQYVKQTCSLYQATALSCIANSSSYCHDDEAYTLISIDELLQKCGDHVVFSRQQQVAKIAAAGS